MTRVGSPSFTDGRRHNQSKKEECYDQQENFRSFDHVLSRGGPQSSRRQMLERVPEARRLVQNED
jgi:hypothetical protein